MAYTVLARRYRSTTFDEVIGQEHVAQTLKKAIASGRIAHAYLFCGTRGTGKTSMARILAKALNCESSDAATTEPCNKCNSCQAIARGDDIDVIEIDAASNTGVDNIRDIIMNAGLGTARSRFKVYIIDEVHMLSKSAFNALLKTLEEPPGHVKFILATTEPEKVLPTILSRCQRYDFRNIAAREVADHLKAICAKEKVKAEDDALLLVAKAGAGSMRDSLSLLDRLLSVGEDQLTVEMIEQMLGLPRTQLLFDLCESIGGGDVKAVLAKTDSIINNGLSPDSLVGSLIDHLRNLLILNTCGPESKLVEVPGLSLADLTKQAQRFDAVSLAQDIAILEELRRNLRFSQAGRALLDATLVRLALAEQFVSIEQLLSDGGNGPTVKPAAQKKKPEPVAPSTPSPAISAPTPPAIPERRDIAPALPMPLPAPAPAQSASSDDADALPAVGKVWEGGPKRNPLLKPREPQKPAAPVASGPIDSNVEPVDPESLPGQWKQVLTILAQHGPGVHGIMTHGIFAGVIEEQAVVKFSPQHESLVKMLDRNGKKETVRQAFTQVLRQPVGVRFALDATTAVAPAAPSENAASVPQRLAPSRVEPAQPVDPVPAGPSAPRLTSEMRDALYANDPLIRAVIDELGGDIVKVE